MMRSIATKLWVAFVLFAVGVLAVLGVLISQIFNQFYLNQQAQHLISKGQIVADILASEGDETKALLYARVITLDTPATIAFINNQGQVSGCTGKPQLRQGVKLSNTDLADINQGKLVVHKGKTPFSEQESISVIVPVINPGPKPGASNQSQQQVNKAVLLYAPLAPIADTTREINLLILSASLAAIAVATLLALLASRTISRPLLQINHAASKMIHGDFSTKIDITSGDEIGRLGRTLNILSTELQDSLDALSREKDQLGNIISSMAEGVVSFDLEGTVIQSNTPAWELLNILEQKQVGNSLTTCCPYPEIKQLFQQALDEKQKVRQEVKIPNRTLAVSMAPLRDSGQDMTGVVMVVRDISKENQLENMRRDFVANVSHELRTPLTLIQGYAEALEEGLAVDEEARQEMVGIIREETNRLKRLVSDLLDLSKMQSGNLQLTLNSINLPSLLERATHPFRPLAREQKIQLKLQLGQQLPEIIGDEDRLAQVLINLLDNALRYTPEGGAIELGVAAKGKGVEIWVQDSGSGISPQEVPYIFERFFKVDKSRRRDSAGTGLGLAIAKSIIQAHGGTFRVESELGKGTGFFIGLNQTDKT
jgi:two-component system sensor histidine kinase ResE